jgi:hypothetical protein
MFSPDADNVLASGGLTPAVRTAGIKPAARGNMTRLGRSKMSA